MAPSYDEQGFLLASDRSARWTRSETTMRLVRVSNTTGPLEALERARAGDEILLSPGTYPIRTQGLRPPCHRRRAVRTLLERTRLSGVLV